MEQASLTVTGCSGGFAMPASVAARTARLGGRTISAGPASSGTGSR